MSGGSTVALNKFTQFALASYNKLHYLIQITIEGILQCKLNT